MSSDPEITRIVRSWLDEGSTQVPDRVLDAVLDQVPATHQRRVTWWPARRHPTISTILKVGLATAVLVVAVLIGSYTFGTPSVGGPGIGGPTPTPEATATPVAIPSATPDDLLPPGPHALTDGRPLDGIPTLPITVTIPAPDWHGDLGGGILMKNDNPYAPDGAGMIVFFGDLYVYGDPCEWSTTRPDTPASTVDELVAALTAQASRDATDPVDVTLDGNAGKSITLQVPEDAVFSDCDSGTFGSWGVPSSDRSPFRYHQDPGQIDKLWIVDVDGKLVVLDIGYYEGTPQAVVDEMEAIVESTTFE